MNYIVATIDDLDMIIKIKNQVKNRIEKEQLSIWLDGYPSDELLKNDILNGFGRVITINNKIVAYACFHLADIEYPKDTFIKDNLYSFGRIMVKDEFLGKHCASFLVKNMIDESKKLGANGMGILVDSCNHKALNLYEHYGFTKEGSKQFPYAYLDIYTLYFN